MKGILRRRRNEVPWSPPYRYVCTHDHEIHASAPIHRCPCYVRGHECPGVLRQLTRKAS